MSDTSTSEIEGTASEVYERRALRELLNPNPPPRASAKQVFAELQKKLDDDALSAHYIALEEKIRQDRAHADRVFDALKTEASREKKRANRAERAPKTWRSLFIITCPALLLFLAIELARHGL